ncbi:MAG: sugar phosphate isomerase/epimerase [Clostridia bacterium]|nr:sugar phosphate isomerase/epimerase [Clostridia bacterium]
MKLSIAFSPFKNLSQYAPFPFHGDPEECIKKLSENDIPGVEISITTPKDIDVEKFEKLLEKYNVEISAIATGSNFTKDGFCMVSPYKHIRKEVVKRLKENIDYASKHETGVIIGGARGSTAASEGANEIEILSRVNECIEELLEYASEKEVILYLEAINRYEIACGKSLYDTARMVRSYNNPYIKMLADTYHMNIEEKKSFFNSIYDNGDVMGYLHLCDNNRMAAGLGLLNFESVFNGLKAIKYDGYICAEVLPLPNPETVIKKTKEVYYSHVVSD